MDNFFNFDDDIFCDENKINNTANSKYNPQMKDSMWFINGEPSSDDEEKIISHKMTYYFYINNYAESFNTAAHLLDVLSSNSVVERRNAIECKAHCAILLDKLDIVGDMLDDLHSKILITDNLISYLMLCEKYYRATMEKEKLVSICKRLLLMLPTSAIFWRMITKMVNDADFRDCFSEEERCATRYFCAFSESSPEDFELNYYYFATIASEAGKKILQVVAEDVRNSPLSATSTFEDSDRLYKELLIDKALPHIEKHSSS